MSLWLFNVYMDGVMKMGMRRRGVSRLEDWVMVGRFAEVCRRRGLKFDAGKSKVMVLNGEEGLV